MLDTHDFGLYIYMDLFPTDLSAKNGFRKVCPLVLELGLNCISQWLMSNDTQSTKHLGPWLVVRHMHT